MNANDVVVIVASCSMAVLALALAVAVRRTTKAQKIESGMTYKFTVPEGTNLPLAPGEWTFRPGKGEAEWKGFVGEVTREHIP